MDGLVQLLPDLTLDADNDVVDAENRVDLPDAWDSPKFFDGFILCAEFRVYQDIGHRRHGSSDPWANTGIIKL